jgi:GNAT superfamily N-acetyltransferase
MVTALGSMIRPAAAGDLDAVAGILGLLHDPPTAVRDQGVWEQMLATPGRTILVAELGGKVVATCDMTVMPNLTHEGRPWAILENLMVAPGARRRGIGRALMNEVERRAREAGCYKLQLVSGARRSQAHLFYRAIGYDPAEGFRLYLE